MIVLCLQATTSRGPAPATQADYWRDWDGLTGFARRFFESDASETFHKHNPVPSGVFRLAFPSVLNPSAMRAHGGLPSGNARPDWPTPGGRGGWGRGRGTWGAYIPGRGGRGPAVSRLSRLYKGARCEAAPPPPSHLLRSASPLAPSWASPGLKKNAGVQCGRIVGSCWVLAGSSDPPKCPILGLPMASGEFFPRPRFYVKVGVLFFDHKLHVTFCHRDFLWLKPPVVKFWADVELSALAPVFMSAGL